MAIDINKHPCFSDSARHTHGRVHLPVAPKCNIQCNFCNRKFDCVNESRPGVTSGVLSPEQAMLYLDEVFEQVPNISVVGIAGPGDPFANAERTMETLTLTREKYPDTILCVATNGLNLAPYVEELAHLDVSHVTVTVNAVDPEVGAKIYAWVRAGKKVERPEAGAKTLLDRQLTAIEGLKSHGVTVKVNTIIMPGINDDHIETVAKTMADMQVDILNCMSYYPTAGSAFENMKPPHPDLVTEVRRKAAVHMPQMHHCARCRADAVGQIGAADNTALMDRLREIKAMPRQGIAAKPKVTATSISSDRPYVAVASMEGMLVNQHLGEARQILIYGREGNRLKLVEARPAPSPGGGMYRWQQLAHLLEDCNTLMVSGIGQSPKQVFAEAGINVLVVEGLIEEAVQSIFTGNTINHLIKRERTVCGAACSGTATGCG